MFSLIHHGRRSSELLKFRNLRVSVFITQNAFALANSFSSASKGNTFTVSYLVDSLGLTPKLAKSISKKVNFQDKVNPDSVLSLLKTHGFQDSQISRIITTCPELLIFDAERFLRPKLEILQAKGGSSSELVEIVSKVPKILVKKREKSISLHYDFVRDIMQDCKSLEYGKMEHSWPEGKDGNKVRNVSVLRELGVPEKLLLQLLVSNCQPVGGKENFEEALKKVVDMGFDPRKSRFVEALHVMYEMSDKTVEEKVGVYKRLGFSEDEIWAIFKRWPFFLKFSEMKITQMFEALKSCGLGEEEVLTVLKSRPQCVRHSVKKVMDCVEMFLGLGFSRDDFKMMLKRCPQVFAYSAEMLKKKFKFLVKKMNWPLEALVFNPAVFGYSLEKRLVPRCNVIKALMSKGLLEGKEPPPISSSVLVCPDEEFLNRYVMKQDNKLVPKLMAIFAKDRGS